VGDASTQPGSSEPAYLKPYADATRAYGARFESLLWVSEDGQRRRFAVLAGALHIAQARVADCGCGRADLLTYLLDHASVPAHYVGIDGVEAMVRAGQEVIERRAAGIGRCERGDFVADAALFARLVEQDGINTIIFSGSLNTLSQRQAEAVLERAFAALSPGGVLAFNFLSSLHTRPGVREEGPARRFTTLAMLRTALEQTPLVRFWHDYLGGHDATIVMRKA